MQNISRYYAVYLWFFLNNVSNNRFNNRLESDSTFNFLCSLKLSKSKSSIPNEVNESRMHYVHKG